MTRFSILLFFLLVCTIVSSSFGAETIRVATYNVSMYRERAGELATELAEGHCQQAIHLATVLQTMRPDILLLNEFDYEQDSKALKLFVEEYLAKPQNDKQPIKYEFRFVAPINTGEQSGYDFDHDGQPATPGDAWGFGRYPGQYGMAILSRFPFDRNFVRTFRKFPWSAMPGARRPADPKTRQSWYTDDEWRALRLSSKSHWDVPVSVPGLGRLHVLASHPTPPVFDGPEDRNGCRNHDEIRLWADYVVPEKSDYIVDDDGKPGGLAEGESFVILGDLNCDPVDGDTKPVGIAQLLEHPRIAAEPVPASEGAAVAANRNAALNSTQRGDSQYDTANFGGDGVANLRVDYVLSSRNLAVVASGVYWPKPDSPEARFISATDHRLVWIDIKLGSAPSSESPGCEAKP